MCALEEPNPFDEIAPNLYLGDKNAAMDLDLITRLKLTHILTAELIPLPHLVKTSIYNQCSVAAFDFALP